MLQEWFGIDGKVALVTGSGRGLGWGIASALAEAGAHVVLNDLDADLLAEKVEDLKSRGLKGTAAQYDVTDAAKTKEVLSGIAKSVGEIDILVSNAGFQNRKDLDQYSDEEIRALMEVHYFGAMNQIRAVTPAMKKKGWGRIVITGSLAVDAIMMPMAPYAAAKGALTAMNRALAMELGPYGITSNIVAPGFFVTEMSQDLASQEDFKSLVDSMIPVGRWAKPEELGPPVVFIASEAGSFYSGQVLEMNGGILTKL